MKVKKEHFEIDALHHNPASSSGTTTTAAACRHMLSDYIHPWHHPLENLDGWNSSDEAAKPTILTVRKHLSHPTDTDFGVVVVPNRLLFLFSLKSLL